MERRSSSGLRRASAATGLLFLVGSGCLKDFDALSASYGKGGSGGNAGASGSGATGGSSASGGVNPGDAGEGGAAAGEGGAGGEGGEQPAAGGRAGSGSGGKGGSAGKGGSSGGDGCAEGSAVCPGSTQCIDLSVGVPAGEGVANCGACGTTCRLDNASSATCATGKCAPNCNSGFDDCNPGDNDGCESDLATPASCGACGKVCSANGTQSQACVSAQCVPTCNARYVDCNSSSVDPLHDDGCEVYLDALDACSPTEACNGASVACPALQVCNGGSCVAPQGLVVLSVPLAAANTKHRFAYVFPTPYPNLEGAAITIRVYAPGATGGFLEVGAVDGNSAFSPAVLQIELKTLKDKWTDITVPVVNLGGFNAKFVKQINLEVSTGGGVGPWTNPTIIYVDSVHTSKVAISDTFDATTGGFANSSMVVIAGSTFTWLNAVP